MGKRTLADALSAAAHVGACLVLAAVLVAAATGFNFAGLTAAADGTQPSPLPITPPRPVHYGPSPSTLSWTPGRGDLQPPFCVDLARSLWTPVMVLDRYGYDARITARANLPGYAICAIHPPAPDAIDCASDDFYARSAAGEDGSHSLTLAMADLQLLCVTGPARDDWRLDVFVAGAESH